MPYACQRLIGRRIERAVKAAERRAKNRKPTPRELARLMRISMAIKAGTGLSLKRHMKPRIFLASSVSLPKVPDEHRGNNGNCQYTILVRAESMKAVAAMLGTSYGTLKSFNGIHPAGEYTGYKDSRVAVASIVQKDGVIYYQPQHTRTGFISTWFEYQPEKKSEKSAR